MNGNYWDKLINKYNDKDEMNIEWLNVSFFVISTVVIMFVPRIFTSGAQGKSKRQIKVQVNNGFCAYFQP